MRTYLVVAHRTLVGRHLLDHALELAGEARDCRFHLVVPARIPNDRSWTDGEIQAEAQQRLAEGLEAFASALAGIPGCITTGEVGDVNPVYAVATALRHLDHDCDGIVVSTLPSGLSHWLRVDVVSRLRREFDLPVTHLVARRAESRRATA